jgi:hypothetical protein
VCGSARVLAGGYGGRTHERGAKTLNAFMPAECKTISKRQDTSWNKTKSASWECAIAHLSDRQGRSENSVWCAIYLTLFGVLPKRRRKQRLKYVMSLKPHVMAISLIRMAP